MSQRVYYALMTFLVLLVVGMVAVVIIAIVTDETYGEEHHLPGCREYSGKYTVEGIVGCEVEGKRFACFDVGGDPWCAELERARSIPEFNRAEQP